MPVTPRARLATTSMAGALALAGLLAGPSAAAADEREPAFTIGAVPAWFLLGGVTGGATVAEGESGFVGGELSLVRLRDGRFVGLYADTYYDFGPGATYVTAGPELGLHVRSRALPLSFGLDGGLALRFDGDTAAGPAGRLSITLFGLFSIYGRTIYLPADGDELVVQAGAMLKFPLTSPFGGAEE